MPELFLNPWSMLAGALLVGVPIVVHLINRLRYRRVRFAAMEFLLKAQKRVRRKLLLQQLILLALRCLLVALVGLLTARFLGFDLTGREGRPSHHVVILDDTPSMADGWKGEDGAATDAFEQAKRVLAREIAPAAAEATAAQTLEVVRLSDLATPRPFGRLSTESVRELDTYLQPLRPGLERVTLAEGLAKAKELLTAQPADTNRVVHVLSDLRASDFGDEAEAVKAAVGVLTADGTKVFLIDTAHPARKPTERRSPAAHDNLTILDLVPARPAVGRFEPVEFTLRVRNFGAAELTDVRFSIRVNGDENRGGRSVVFPSIPGNQERAVKFEVTFDQLGTPEQPLNRFSLVTANLETGEPGGLRVDNVRHAVVEVKERLPILVIDGHPERKESRDGDSFFLRPVFTSVLGGYGWRDGTTRDLESLDLSRFAFVLLLNVPTLADPAVKALETYCLNGGGVGFWLGPDINPKEYNERLYRDGAGLFPVPLADKPTDELPEEEQLRRRYQISQKKFLVRDAAIRAHPALAGLYLDERGLPAGDVDKLERVFGFISIRRHWPVPRGRWRDDKAVVELYCLPNDGKTANYEVAVRRVVDAIPVELPEYAAYRDVLKPLRDDLKRIGDTGEPLYQLANALDDLLAEGADTTATAKLREFWANPKTATLRTDAARLRDEVKFGDPFYLSKSYGQGRVTLITTTAGDQWSDWPSEPPGSASYAPIIKELGGYLSGGGVPQSRPVGKLLELQFPADQFRPVAGRTVLTHDPSVRLQPNQSLVSRTDLNEQSLIAEGSDLKLRFSETTLPGAYLFTASGVKPGADGLPANEYRAVTVNVDTRESDLRRVAGDDIQLLAPNAKVVAASDSSWLNELRDRRADLSEGVWLVLLLALLLAVEQWLSVRLSFHHTGETASA